MARAIPDGCCVTDSRLSRTAVALVALSTLVAPVALAAAGGEDGSTAAPDRSSFDARIAALEAQVRQIKAESNSWLTSDQAKALVQDAVTDSSSRASLLRDGGMAGFKDGHGFFISNEDGSFDVNIAMYSKFRAVWNNMKNQDTSTFGFENSETKISFEGHAGSPDLTYRIEGGFEPSGGGFTLEDAWGSYNLGQGWSVGWGQTKAPFEHEFLVEDTKGLAVDRSFLSYLTGLGRVQGAWLHYGDNNMHAWLAFDDGNLLAISGPHGDTGANVPFNSDDTEFAFTGRVEFLLHGNWDSFEDYTSWADEDKDCQFMVGAAGHYQVTEYGRNFSGAKAFTWTADAAWKYGGANLSASVVGVHFDSNSNLVPTVNQLGFMVQGGYQFVPDKWEAFGRYEYFDYDNAPGTTQSLSMVTAGVNYYFHKHQWKWTTDVVWSLHNNQADISEVGILEDGNGTAKNQYAIRTQMQVALP